MLNAECGGIPWTSAVITYNCASYYVLPQRLLDRQRTGGLAAAAAGQTTVYTVIDRRQKRIERRGTEHE